jgi:hypothetical protein
MDLSIAYSVFRHSRLVFLSVVHSPDNSNVFIAAGIEKQTEETDLDFACRPDIARMSRVDSLDTLYWRANQPPTTMKNVDGNTSWHNASWSHCAGTGGRYHSTHHDVVVVSASLEKAVPADESTISFRMRVFLLDRVPLSGQTGHSKSTTTIIIVATTVTITTR